MKNRKYCAIARGIEELVGVPTGGEGTSFRLAVTDDATDDQIWIVEGRSIRMCQRIAKLAAFVNGAGGFRRYMTGNSIGPGKLTKQPVQAVPAALDGRIAFGV
jgi:hypothetical protein